MQVLAIGVLLLLVLVFVSSMRPTRPQVIYVVEQSSARPNGCLLLLALAIVMLFAVSR